MPEGAGGMSPQELHSLFYTDEATKTMYKYHMETLVFRENTINGYYVLA